MTEIHGRYENLQTLEKSAFLALEGKKFRKLGQGKEFEKNSVLGRKKPIGEKMGRTRGEKTVQTQATPTDTEYQNQGGYPHD